MKTYTTSDRLRSVMRERNLRQVDILEAAKPYCNQYDVKLGKNDLSQYISGKVEPSQKKLTILSLALDVSEAWLMGYDVPQDRMTREPLDLSESGASEMGSVFSQLSQDNQAKLLELGRLFLVSQRIDGEKK